MNFNVGALSDYSQAIALNPKDSIAYANRGRLKKLYFDNEGAAIDLDQAIALAETQVFIKNVKPLLSNEHYIAAIPVVQGLTDNPPMIKIEPSKSEKLTYNSEKDSHSKYSGNVVAKDNTKNENKLAMSETKQNPAKENVVKPAVTTKTETKNTEPEKLSSATLKAGVGIAKSEPVPDIRTSSVSKAPTTNIKLAESYYIRGLQKCVLRDLQGAIADLDKAIANNSKYADAYFYRAAIKKELGDIDGFRKDYSTAIQINPALQQYNDIDTLTVIHG